MHTRQTRFAEATVGGEIPAGTAQVNEVQLFFFSAATNNGHRVHYDRQYATQVEGHPDLLVHGPLQVALMARTITDWIGPGGRLLSIRVRYVTSVFPGEQLRFEGRVAAKREVDGLGVVDLDVAGVKEPGTVFMAGTASVSLPW